ncbi:YacL family protein [Alkalimarinus sediminis]|uniref:YacL family protein n=1 Tax=Alkalimarinus sediminis TaxID=1632866 RepID=A0A9E8HJC9_9ALTE|nr:YacL family protein [Alkalimarinus sediminis]UZW73773.1 YacL family protein [Alkalimarinus sediminis]
MDYEFTIDEQYNPVAQFSIGHEAIGLWFTEELSNNKQAIARLLDVIQQLEAGKTMHYNTQGKTFQLRLDSEQAEVVALALDIDIDEELPENTELYDQESYAECGISDFKQAVIEWEQFVI